MLMSFDFVSLCMSLIWKARRKRLLPNFAVMKPSITWFFLWSRRIVSVLRYAKMYHDVPGYAYTPYYKSYKRTSTAVQVPRSLNNEAMIRPAIRYLIVSDLLSRHHYLYQAWSLLSGIKFRVYSFFKPIIAVHTCSRTVVLGGGVSLSWFPT